MASTTHHHDILYLTSLCIVIVIISAAGTNSQNVYRITIVRVIFLLHVLSNVVDTDLINHYDYYYVCNVSILLVIECTYLLMTYVQELSVWG